MPRVIAAMGCVPSTKEQGNAGKRRCAKQARLAALPAAVAADRRAVAGSRRIHREDAAPAGRSAARKLRATGWRRPWRARPGLRGARNPNSAPDSIRGFGTTRIRYAVAAKRRAAPYRPAGGRAARHYMRRCASAISSQVRTWISHARARPLRSWVNHWTRAGVDAVAAFMMTSGLVPRGKPVLYGSRAALQQAIPFLQQIGCDRAPRPPSQATSRRIRPAFS